MEGKVWGQLNEEDRAALIKEARQAVLHDVSQALVKLQDKFGQSDPDLVRFARYFGQCLGERLTEVVRDAATYPQLSSRRVWSGDE
jgi:hypothetical protein